MRYLLESCSKIIQKLIECRLRNIKVYFDSFVVDRKKNNHQYFQIETIFVDNRNHEFFCF